MATITTYIIRTFGGVLPITLNTTPIVPPTPNVTFYVRGGTANANTYVRQGSANVTVRGA